jgi:alpha-ketoglutarate-dependent taurine dioxygenase
MHFPLIKESNGQSRTWIRENLDLFNRQMDTHGAVLLRGSGVSDEVAFKDFVSDFSSKPLEYLYRSTPRTDLGGGIYTATEYPAGLAIPLHNENAYQRDWPLRLFFYCMQPATEGGGQTTVAKTLAVTKRISPTILERFRKKGVMYIRNYRPDIDLSWRTVFQTDSKEQVEAYCDKHGIEREWTPAGTLKTRQTSQALAKHPRTGAVVWFNQAHLFHPSGLDPNTQQLMREMFREDELPRNATYGDGSPIEESDLENIRDAFKQETITFEWRVGDILVLDNMLVSHGRTPYKGRRRVLTAMCDSYSSSLLDDVSHRS